MRPRPSTALPAAAALAAVVAGGLGASPGRPYPASPPPAHTGGFGEPTCYECHFEGELNEAGGSLMLDGLPEAYEPGRTYRITVTLTRPGLAQGGFQLAARFAEGATAGRQAGTLRAIDERVEVVRAGEPAVEYASHSFEGTEPVSPDTVRWAVEWSAPAEAGGDVAFHAVGNAADGDASPFGDRIYATARSIKAAAAIGSARRITTSGVPCQAAHSRMAEAMSRTSASESLTPGSR
jgi:hypothetical protein